MIYLIFGEDKVQIRLKLQQYLQKYEQYDVSQVASKVVSTAQINDLLRARSMFGSKRLVVVEGKVDAKGVAWDVVGGHDSECDLIVYVEGTVRTNEILYKEILERGGEIEKCELGSEREIFDYLDAILRRNRAEAIEELEKLFALGKDSVYIHTMLVWQFRQLLAPGLLKSFMQKKALAARKLYSEEDLIKIYKSLLQIDVHLKTGTGDPQTWLMSLTAKITH
jgi:DNA polymerase III delta subunit